jgi:pyruvate kinase
MKKTKIICTIGPASQHEDLLRKLVDAGMTAARLNFSHGSHDERREQITRIRTVATSLGRPITLIADLQGPKLRLGELTGERTIKAGESVVLSSRATGDELPTQLDLSQIVKKGERILINDGIIELEVKDISGEKITALAKNTGTVDSFKGINIPDSTYTKGTFTEKDREDLLFALSQDVDYVALSYVQSAADIERVRGIIADKQSPCKIIAKIERREATVNIESIIKAADGVMVARGDLAIETSPAEVPIMQLHIIRLARHFQKPVIIATQMLESMITNPRPTRAEASDIAHAVLYQVDAVMLSGESAVGKYPVEAVSVMTSIIEQVEQNPEFKQYIKINITQFEEDILKLSAIASTAATFAYKVHADKLVVATASGKTARIISSFRPDNGIIAVTHSETVRNQLHLLWGVVPIIVNPVDDNNTFWKTIVDEILGQKLAERGQKAVMVSGTQVGMTGATDSIKLVTL